MIFSNLNKKNSKISFLISNIDTSILNSIRRTILADIPNVGFNFNPHNYHEYPDINIINNDTPLHNEIIAHRISLIPINVSSDELESWNHQDYKFVINKTNKNNTDIIITTDDINVIYKDEPNEELKKRFFPKNPLTKDHIIISKLNNTIDSKFHIEAIATVNTPSNLASYGIVSTCTYNNVVDEELVKSEIEKLKIKTKEKIINNEFLKIKEIVNDYIDDEKIKNILEKNYKKAKKEINKLLPNNIKINDLTDIDTVIEDEIKKFNTLDIYRHYHKNSYLEPNLFEFTIESECAITPIYVFNKALLILLNKINTIIQNIEDIVIIKNDELHTIILENENHTIGNLIQSLMFNKYIREDNNNLLSYIGYTVPHPLENILVIKIKGNYNDPKEFFVNGLIYINDLIKDVYDQWNTFSS